MVVRRAEKVDQRLWQKIASGSLALFIAMGIGRFAYTPILPLMQKQVHVTNSMAGYLASSNYLGYLFGAFAVGSATWLRRNRLQVYRCSLWMNILTTGAMAATSHYLIWCTLRLISGLTSGIVFVLASSMVLEELKNQHRSSLSGLYYGGVGGGIAVSGLTVPIFANLAGWRGTWLGLMFVTIVCGVPAVFWMKDAQDTFARVTSHDTHYPSNHLPRSFFPWLVVAYGLEGLGYIITGTFIVALTAATPGLDRYAPYSWIVVGVSAMPSCVIWACVVERYGFVLGLVSAFLLQAIGVLLPVVVKNWIGMCLGAVLFGGTFMGITTTATMLVKSLRPEDGGQAIGLMTGVYGIGQIVGAAGAGTLAHYTGGFVLPTLVASGVLFLGAAVLSIGAKTRMRRSSLFKGN